MVYLGENFRVRLMVSVVYRKSMPKCFTEVDLIAKGSLVKRMFLGWEALRDNKNGSMESSPKDCDCEEALCYHQ